MHAFRNKTKQKIKIQGSLETLRYLTKQDKTLYWLPPHLGEALSSMIWKKKEKNIKKWEKMDVESSQFAEWGEKKLTLGAWHVGTAVPPSLQFSCFLVVGQWHGRATTGTGRAITSGHRLKKNRFSYHLWTNTYKTT